MGITRYNRDGEEHVNGMLCDYSEVEAKIAELEAEKFKLGNYISILQQGIEEAFMAGARNPYKAHFKMVKEAKKYADNLEKSDG